MTKINRNLDGQVALVTGASGFIGTHLCQRLLAQHVEVHALSRSESPIKHESLKSWQADLTNYELASKIISEVRPNRVFHLASHVMGAPDLKHVLPTFHSNLHTTVNLLTALAETGCERVVLTGSLVEPAPAELQTVPGAPYAAAKWAASNYARMFHAIYELPTTIARVFMVYGPGQKDRTKLVPYVIRSLDKGEAPEITSGQRLVDWIYVDDVVSGFLAMATAPGIEGQSVDLGSGELITTRDIVVKIAAAMKSRVQPRFGALTDRPMEPVCAADTKRSFAMTGWKPEVSLNNGMKNTIEYFKKLKD